MTSQVAEQLVNYNKDYPVAGQDNDSQQFRTNFSEIKTAFQTADLEITDLKNNTAKTNDTTDFNDQIIQNARFKRLHGMVATISTNTTQINDLDVSEAVYWIGQTNGNCSIQFKNWPTSGTQSKVSQILIELRSSGSANQVSFSTYNGSVYRDNSGSITAGTSAGTQKIVLSTTATTRTILEAWTPNGGSIVYLNFIGQFQQ